LSPGLLARLDNTSQSLIPEVPEFLMPTFAEYQAAVNDLRYQREILQHVMEHLDESFMPKLDAKPARVLLTEDRLPVPQESFDKILTALATWIEGFKKQEAMMTGVNIAVVALPPEPAEPQKTEVTPVEEKKEAPPVEPEDAVTPSTTEAST
jgi:hypothetical protein